jgi:hypothetical protein
MHRRTTHTHTHRSRTGSDRVDKHTKKMAVAPFDSRAVDMFRSVGVCVCSARRRGRCIICIILLALPLAIDSNANPTNKQTNRVLATKSDKPTHFFPLAMLTGQILPPPAKVI